jgi:hypothetical protein
MGRHMRVPARYVRDIRAPGSVGGTIRLKLRAGRLRSSIPDSRLPRCRAGAMCSGGFELSETSRNRLKLSQTAQSGTCVGLYGL